VKLGGRRPPPLAPDPELVRQLAGLLAETGLSEIEYSIGEHRIRVARETAPKAVIAPPPIAVEPTPAYANGAARNGTDHAPAPNGGGPPAGALTSPMVGVAYLAPQPGAAPFVRVGDTVGEGQTVLIIEAMKVMNQIRAPRGGRVSKIFIDDAEPVEYGAPLLLIE
jgi:acetyl-CoA carboxylase biotin carboxyl carrier protein